MFKIGEKELQIPIIQGGMGIGISLEGLASAVAKEGGIGLISAAQIGFAEVDFEKNPLEANLRAMERKYLHARNATTNGMIGFNIMVAMRHYETYVKKAVEIGAELIVSGAGLPVNLPAYVEGSNTKIAPIVSTEKSAKVILKYWDKKYNRTADLVVVEGPKAGGHLGFTKEDLAYYNEEAYEEELRKVLAVVQSYAEKYHVHIPVAAAGGICSSAQVKKMLDMGFDAVQVGSRFVTTVECDADVRYKETYLHAKKEDIIIVKSPVGMPGRAIRNAMLEKVMDGGRFAPKKCYGCLEKCDPSSIPYCITKALIHAATGNVEDALLFCGAESYRAEKIETVKEVVADLLKECV